MLSFFPRDILDEILNFIESVSEVFPSYSCMPHSGHFMDIEGQVLVHQTKTYDSVYFIMPHGDKGRFLVLIFTPPLSNTNLV